MAPSPPSRPGRLLLALLAVVIALTAAAFWPGTDHTIRLGLDLQGGTQVILKPTPVTEGATITEEQLAQTVATPIEQGQAALFKDVVTAIEALAGTIHHVHAKDTRIEEPAAVRSRLETTPNERVTERAWNYVAVGTGHPDGVVFWCQFAEALRAAGYDGVLSIENEDYSLSQPDSVAIAARTLTEAAQGGWGGRLR